MPRIPALKAIPRTFLLRFRFLKDTTRFELHHTAVNGHLCRIIKHPLPSVDDKPMPPWVVVPHVLEFGKRHYTRGEPYHIGLSYFGQFKATADELALHIRLNETKTYSPDDRLEELNLRLESVEELPAPQLDRPIATLQALERVTLLFCAPLRIEQKIGHRIFDSEYFDVPHFFKQLYRRMYDLAKLNRTRMPAFAYPGVPDVQLTDNRLKWVHIPARELSKTSERQPAAKESSRAAVEHSGAMGEVVLSGQIAEWARLLVLGQFGHIGKSTNYGFGRYVIKELLADSVNHPARALPSAENERALIELTLATLRGDPATSRDRERGSAPQGQGPRRRDHSAGPA